MLNKSNKDYSYEDHRNLFESFKAKCTKSKKGKEGGCVSRRDAADQKPTSVILVLPEKQIKQIKESNFDQTLLVDPSCLRKPK